MSQPLTQEQIDAFFESGRVVSAETGKRSNAVQFDFRRPERISKTQMRALHILHEGFVRNLASSLSAYLRSYITVSLLDVDQLSYVEFLEGLQSPTCVVSIGMRPFEGTAILELNPALVFPVIELLLGGTAKSGDIPKREITEIEQSLLTGLFRIIIQELKNAWKGVASIDFTIESVETKTQFIRALAPQEVVVAVRSEIQLSQTSGVMSLAIPSNVIKMMRQKSDQNWAARRLESSPGRQAQILRALKPSMLDMEVLLEGPTIGMRELLGLKPGDLLVLDHGIQRPLRLTVNGICKFEGKLLTSNGRKSLQIEALHRHE